MPLVHRTMNPDGVCEGALHIADAVLAAVTPVIRQQALLEAERAIFNDALCNEGTPYDSLLGAIQVVKRLRESAVIARSHSTQPGEETKR